MRFLLLIATLVLFSCSKNERITQDFSVEALVFGGMCGYEKKIVITSNLTNVSIKYGGCNGKDSTASYKTDETKFNQLKQKLQEVNFKTLNLDECGRCYDALDYRIVLNDSGQTYESTIAQIYEDQASIDKQRLRELQQLINSF